MCQSNPPQHKTNENESFVRQSFLRGHLAPAFRPPTKTCPRCLQNYTGTKTMCLPCIKAVYAEKEKDKDKDKDVSRDTYIDDCEMCKKSTLHLGPGWCVECYAASDAVFPLYCEECVVSCDVPVSVKDDKGGFVDMLKVRSLWCVSCQGVADSWVRLDY
ncbi:hypothetical protein ACHAPI_012058 [Fusarium lateritium]